MARGCDSMAENQDQLNGELEVPVIQIENGLEEEEEEQDLIDVDDDDDAAVYLQELGLNFGITARSKGKSSATFQNASREGSAISSGIMSVLSRQKSSRTLVEVVNRVAQGGEGHLYRLLSAKRNHVQQLNSDIVFLQKRIKELEEQNRLLVRLNKRQEAALHRYQDMKTELPHIIEAHKIEINVLQEKLRRSTEVNRRNTDKLKVTDVRIIKLTEELSRLKDLSKKRNLPERDQLNKKLSYTTQLLQEKEKEVEELQRRLALIEKSLKQQVQAEVGRHRSTAKKLYSLQCEHTLLQDTLKDREKELAALQHYRCRTSRSSGSISSSISTTASSSRSESVSARPIVERHRGSSSAVTTTSGVVSTVDEISTSDSRGSLTLDTGRLPPISGDPRMRDDGQATTSPEPGDVPMRRSRLRGHIPGKLIRDATEDRRTARLKRGRRSPRPSTDDDSLPTPGGTPTPSPSSTPEPQNLQHSESNGEATDGSTTLSGHADQRRRQRLAANLQETHQQNSLEANEDESAKPNTTVKPRPMTRQYSLIENYPPRERTGLTGGSSAGSDSGSGVSPPPIKPSPFIREPRGPSRLSRLDSALPPRALQRRQNTVASTDLRPVSSLSKLDSESAPKPTRAAITP